MKTCSALPPEQVEFLRKWAELFEAEQPKLLELRGRLLDIDGEEVLWQQQEQYLDELIEAGRVFPLKGRRRRFIADSECHRNAASLWYRTEGAVRISTGYALGEGLWVPHSWGYQAGRIVETTSVRRSRYFGVELEGLEALRFVFSNGPMDEIQEDIEAGTCFRELILLVHLGALTYPLAAMDPQMC